MDGDNPISLLVLYTLFIRIEYCERRTGEDKAFIASPHQSPMSAESSRQETKVRSPCRLIKSLVISQRESIAALRQGCRSSYGPYYGQQYALSKECMF